MKRVNLNIDLKENEVFDKEVQEIVRAKVRETVRNEYSMMIQDAVSEEFKRLFDANTYGYRDKLNETVKKCAITGIKEVLEGLDVSNLIREKAVEIMDVKMDCYFHDSEHRCKIAFDPIVIKQAEERNKRS